MILLGMLQNLALVFAAWSERRQCQRLAALLSGFIVLFSVGISLQFSTLLVAGGYGICGLWWMSLQYWRKLHATQVASSVQHCWPARVATLTMVAGAILLASAVLLGRLPTSTYVLQGLFPTSGGNRWSDEFARAGVGDGKAMIAAKEQPQSFGPVQSDLLLESEMPSLYDMFNDMYGEPYKPRSREKVISLPSQKMLKNHEKLAISKLSGREFSTLRRHASQQQQTLADRDSAAIMYVIGQTPLHLALETHDSFDGAQWISSAIPQDQPSSEFPKPKLMNEGAKPWVDVARLSDFSIFRGMRTHAVKIINFQSNRIPAPPHLSRVHIDRLDRPEFFRWTADGMLEMVGRERIPQLTILELQSPGLELTALRETDFTESLHRGAASNHVSSSFGLIPDHLSRFVSVPTAYRDLADCGTRWTTGVPRGWRQVEAIVRGFRTEFQHDPTYQVPENVRESLPHFMQARRGPDYLFASAAALVLRTQGYPTRFVSGFYVRPERYDRSAGQSSVLAEDVHCWLEVCVEGQTWVTVEPTPGYEFPPESLPWHERCRVLTASILLWMEHNLWGLGFSASLIGLGWVARITWYEWVLNCVCWIGILCLPAKRVIWTARLLECRANLARQPRPPATTTTVWYSRWLPTLEPATSHCLQAFLDLLDRELYAPAASRKSTIGESGNTEHTCSQLMAHPNKSATQHRKNSPRMSFGFFDML